MVFLDSDLFGAVEGLPRWALGGLALLAIYLSRNAVVNVYKRQAELSKQIAGVEKAAKDDWERHDEEHSRIAAAQREELQRIRDTMATNSEDIARLLERTRKLE